PIHRRGLAFENLAVLGHHLIAAATVGDIGGGLRVAVLARLHVGARYEHADGHILLRVDVHRDGVALDGAAGGYRHRSLAAEADRLDLADGNRGAAHAWSESRVRDGQRRLAEGVVETDADGVAGN